MSFSNIIVVVILAAVIFIALKGSIKHLKGEGGCCGGGDSVKKEPDKKLCRKTYPQFASLHDAEMERLNSENKPHLSSMGIR